MKASLTAEEYGAATALDKDTVEPQAALLSDKAATRAVLTGIAGREMSIGATHARSYLADAYNVNGGTGAAIVEVADPSVRFSASGLVLGARVVPVAGKRLAEVRVHGESARPPRFGRRIEIGGRARHRCGERQRCAARGARAAALPHRPPRGGHRQL
jgi:hypothetical protein